MIKFIVRLLLISTFSWGSIIPAAENYSKYLPLLKGKRVALVVNQSSRVGKIHLVDFLLNKRVKVVKIFAPEHGFRGKADAGKYVKSSRDMRTNLPIISLYGKNKKPTKRNLLGVDIILFDIQDVGVRFYTYLSTLHFIMEAGAKYHKPLIVLDRPNPNGHFVDGPILESKYRSFVGLDPVPLVYGMTIGEYAKMLNGERWIGSKRVNLTIIPISNYTHNTPYRLPIKPSPNLPTAKAIALYPSLALFEGTIFSAGRGTKQPFELYGHPRYTNKKFSFTPKSRIGALHPKFKNRKCYGVNLKRAKVKSQINLSYLLNAYNNYPNKKKFFLKNRFIDKLAGSNKLRKQILLGMPEAKIRTSWQQDLKKFKKIRKKYLIYK
ncbi:MAG: DUF1343 domain-containing protein [Sulfurovum sp.]|nr:DUF1343 domain-containing protein [Sulfurovaceae bacterium]